MDKGYFNDEEFDDESWEVDNGSDWSVDNSNPTSQDIDSTSQDIDSTSQDIDSTSQDIDSTSQDIDSTSQDIDSTSQDIDSTSQDIDSTSQDIDTSKKSKKSKKSKFKTNQTVVEKSDRVLYIVTDKYTPDLINYMRSCGLHVSEVFGHISDLRNRLLLSFNDTRIVIIDTGTGKFITPAIRKELIDMIGVNDESTKFTVFYTDSIIKSDTMEVIGKAGKSVEWLNYKSTAICIATMLSHNENYIKTYDSCSDTTRIDEKQILNYRGLNANCEFEKTSPPSITASAIYKNVVESQDSPIRGFKVKI